MKGRKGHLTAMERGFSAKMAATGDPAYSAEKAGYAFPSASASKLLRNPDVAANIQRAIETEIQDDLAPLAVWRLRKVLKDDLQKGSTHVMAAKIVLGYALNRVGAGERDLSEMNAAEIRELLGEAQRAYAARLDSLKDITPAKPDCAQAAPNVFE